MALFSDPLDHYSHRVRIVMEEKGVSAELINSDMNNLSKEIIELSPYATLPVLVDRDVCLYDSIILMEYLDERFPHPPLLPVYPVARAHMRLFIQRIEEDWCTLFDKLLEDNLKDSEKKKIRQDFRSHLIGTISILKEKPYFMSDDFSLVDCCIGPILWRLPLVGIEIKEEAKTRPLHEYMKLILTRPAFLESLSEEEREIRSIT
tara:strand:+ start:708 stop:1322 length:615 start_codon:yes stop_codon:yes gene_type:complete